MRKVLSFVLVLSLVLGSFGSVFAASSTSTTFPDVVGTDYEDAVNVLVDLGVVAGNPDGTYKPADVVNRAEMARMIVVAMGMENSVADQKSSFTDISGYGWAEGYIAYAQSMDIIAGYGDGTFKPGNPVSYDEAAKMLVAALGYTPASLTGSWPANYVSKAKALKITEDVTSGAGGATRGDVAIMIYQTLTVPIGTVNSDGVWTATNYKSAKDDEDNFDTMLGRLGAEQMNGGKAFILTNDIADSAAVSVRSLVGSYVKAYENKDNELIAISEMKSEFVTGEIDDNKFDSGDVEYNLSNAVANSTMAVFYNGTDLETAAEDKINLKAKEGEGAVVITDAGKMSVLGKDDKVGDDEKLLFFDVNGTKVENREIILAADVNGKTIREIYSVSVWDVVEDFQFDSDMANEIKNDQELYGYEIPLDDWDEIDYNGFQLIGVDTLDDLKVGNVIYLYADADDVITRLEVGTQTVTGEVTRVRNDNELTIGGTTYKVARPNDVDEDVSAGDDVVLYLTYNGKYYATEATSGSTEDFAVVIGMAHPDKENSIDSARLQLFLADGTSKTFSVDDGAKKVKRYIGSDSKWMVIPGDLVKYSVDKSGDIDSLEVPRVDNEQTGDEYNTNYTFRTVEAKGFDISSRGYYNSRQINSNAVIYVFDDDIVDGTLKSSEVKASNLSVSSTEKISGLEDVIANYVTNKDGRIVAMVLAGDAVSGTDTFGVVIESGTNNSDAGGWIQFYIDGKKVTYNAKKSFVQDSLYEFEEAFVQLKFDTNGDVSSVDFAHENEKVTPYGKTSKVLDADSNKRNIVIEDENGDALSFTVDSNYQVYILKTNGDWTTASNLKDVDSESGWTYSFFDIDEDDVIDTVIIDKYTNK